MCTEIDNPSTTPVQHCLVVDGKPVHQPTPVALQLWAARRLQAHTRGWLVRRRLAAAQQAAITVLVCYVVCSAEWCSCAYTLMYQRMTSWPTIKTHGTPPNHRQAPRSMAQQAMTMKAKAIHCLQTLMTWMMTWMTLMRCYRWMKQHMC